MEEIINEKEIVIYNGEKETHFASMNFTGCKLYDITEGFSSVYVDENKTIPTNTYLISSTKAFTENAKNMRFVDENMFLLGKWKNRQWSILQHVEFVNPSDADELLDSMDNLNKKFKGVIIKHLVEDEIINNEIIIPSFKGDIDSEYGSAKYKDLDFWIDTMNKINNDIQNDFGTSVIAKIAKVTPNGFDIIKINLDYTYNDVKVELGENALMTTLSWGSMCHDFKNTFSSDYNWMTKNWRTMSNSNIIKFDKNLSDKEKYVKMFNDRRDEMIKLLMLE